MSWQDDEINRRLSQKAARDKIEHAKEQIAEIQRHKLKQFVDAFNNANHKLDPLIRQPGLSVDEVRTGHQNEDIHIFTTIFPGTIKSCGIKYDITNDFFYIEWWREASKTSESHWEYYVITENSKDIDNLLRNMCTGRPIIEGFSKTTKIK